MSRLLQFTRNLINNNKVSLSRNILTIRNSGKLIKTYSTKSEETFVKIYMFPYAPHVAVGLTLKTYLIAGTIAATCISGVLEISGVAPQYLSISFLLLGFVIIAVSLPFQYLLKNTIGILYVTQNLQKIKISYVDFWGKRVDKIIFTRDWIPLSDLPVLRTDRFFLVPRLYTEKTNFRLFLAENFVLDKEKMNIAIGEANPTK